MKLIILFFSFLFFSFICLFYSLLLSFLFFSFYFVHHGFPSTKHTNNSNRTQQRDKLTNNRMVYVMYDINNFEISVPWYYTCQISLQSGISYMINKEYSIGTISVSISQELSDSNLIRPYISSSISAFLSLSASFSDKHIYCKH